MTKPTRIVMLFPKGVKKMDSYQNNDSCLYFKSNPDGGRKGSPYCHIKYKHGTKSLFYKARCYVQVG